MALLEVQSIDAFYGRVRALSGVSLKVDKGEIVALIGSNGAGKTTTLRTISGLKHPATGTITFNGHDITQTDPSKIVKAGLCQSPEGRRLFPRLSVSDNLLMGAYTRRDRQGIRDDIARVYDLFPRLKERSGQLAGTLSGGEQQMLAVARALMLRPRLMLLDEPSLGLAPMVVQEIFRILRTVNKQSGVSILLVEQNAKLALDLADHVFLLETGRVVMSGPSAALAQDDSIRRAYLGY